MTEYERKIFGFDKMERRCGGRWRGGTI